MHADRQPELARAEVAIDPQVAKKDDDRRGKQAGVRVGRVHQAIEYAGYEHRQPDTHAFDHVLQNIAAKHELLPEPYERHDQQRPQQQADRRSVHRRYPDVVNIAERPHGAENQAGQDLVGSHRWGAGCRAGWCHRRRPGRRPNISGNAMA